MKEKVKMYRVDFYHISYQYREPEYAEVRTYYEFEQLKKRIRMKLEADAEKSFVSGGTFWASFSKSNGDDSYSETVAMFPHRIRVEKKVYHISE